MTIRPAARADVPAVVRLMRELADFEKLPGPDAAAETRLAADLGVRYHAFVAERPVAGQTRGQAQAQLDPISRKTALALAPAPAQPSEIVAYALVYETYSTFAARPVLWLEDLYVTPAARRSGVARALMDAVAADARQRGCARVAWAVLDWNAPAISFYERLGAQRKPWLWYELAL